ncbi:hypothetical protein PTKIN_Ptkin06aG0048200 [Pterospermum kingtungense]
MVSGPEIEKNKEFDLTKKVWDSDAIENLKQGCENSGADLAVIMLQQGSGQVFLVGQMHRSLRRVGKNDGLKEILHDREVMGLIKNTKAAVEIRAYKEFSDLLLKDSDRACYGARSVEVAIETLLITDDLLSNKEIGLRQKYMELMKPVKKAGGKVFVSGEELAQLTGIAAILRFPLPDLDQLVL